MVRFRWVRVGALMVGLALVAAGCGTPRHTMTGAQAIQQLDSYLAESVASAPGGLHLVRITAEATNTSSCTKGLTDEGTGQVEAEVRYEAKDVSPDTATQYLDVLERLWKQKGWGGLQREQTSLWTYTDDSDIHLYAVHYPDPVTQEYATGPFDIQGLSPCIWASGTPGPADNP